MASPWQGTVLHSVPTTVNSHHLAGVRVDDLVQLWQPLIKLKSNDCASRVDTKAEDTLLAFV
jgi:hypothetical protein